MTTLFRPVRIHARLHISLRIRDRDLPDTAMPRCALAVAHGSAPAGWWLTRMLLQSSELDRLIGELQRQQRRLPKNARKRWHCPGWLESSLPLGLARGEYDAVIQALSARRADLGRTYLPLMNAVKSGRPVPVAVASIIAC